MNYQHFRIMSTSFLSLIFNLITNLLRWVGCKCFCHRFYYQLLEIKSLKKPRFGIIMLKVTASAIAQNFLRLKTLTFMDHLVFQYINGMFLTDFLREVIRYSVFAYICYVKKFLSFWLKTEFQWQKFSQEYHTIFRLSLK